MKKARIMLAAIAVLGLVGGTLAFRAHNKFVPSGFYTLTTSYNGITFTKTLCAPAFVSVAGSVPAGVPYFATLSTIGNATDQYYTTVGGSTVYCTTTVNGLFLASGE